MTPHKHTDHYEDPFAFDFAAAADLLLELTRRRFAVVTHNARTGDGIVAAIAKEAWGKGAGGGGELLGGDAWHGVPR